ncbi:hypothetical protein OF897_19745, partial [Chryseobacterium formosus]|nr:hypothetical protein [Chryseobacterium formosus]
PLIGTEPNKPLTGDFKLNYVNFKTGSDGYEGNMSFDPSRFEITYATPRSSNVAMINSDAVQLRSSGTAGNGNFSELYMRESLFRIRTDGVSPRGLTGYDDYTANIEALDYVQKKYVDTNLANETLATIINRGNYSPKSIGIGGQTDPIYFSNDSNTFNIGITETDYLNKSGVTGSVNMAIGYSTLKNITSGSYNLAIGPFSGRDITTGYGNTLYGQGTGSVITSGSYNTAIGYNAGTKITTPQWNTFVGYGNNEATTTGFKNTSLGTYANASGAGNLNTVIGYKAANTKPIGDRNIIIGASAAQGATGSNNILIGIGAGQSDGAISNKLIIHSNHTLTGYSNTAEGNFGSFQQSTLSRALITGDFVERWARINGYFVVGNPASENNNIIINPSTGITAALFYTPSTDNSFVQKKYVDEKTEFIKYNSSNESLTSYTKRRLNALEGESAYMHILGQFNISANSFTTLIFTSNNVAVGIKKIIGKTNTGDYVDLIVESIADGTTRIINPSDNDYTDLVINSYLLGEATNRAE